jgi:hypothetical protein
VLSVALAIEQALRGTALDGVSACPVPVGDTDGAVAFELSYDGLDPMVAWRAARSALSVTGRWPVLVFDGAENALSRKAFTEGMPVTPASPAAIVAASWHVVHEPEPPDGGLRLSREDWERCIDQERSTTEARNGSAPDRAELLRRFPTPSFAALDAYLFAWEEQRLATPSGLDVERPDHGPIGPKMAHSLVLLPTSRPEEVAAYIYSWGMGGEGLVASLRSWNQRFGAEPCAAVGTVVTLLVARPPADIRQAYRIAAEMEGYNIHMPDLRTFAREIIGRAWWELYNRP